jgi:hypothetical protein
LLGCSYPRSYLCAYFWLNFIMACLHLRRQLLDFQLKSIRRPSGMRSGLPQRRGWNQTPRQRSMDQGILPQSCHSIYSWVCRATRHNQQQGPQGLWHQLQLPCHPSTFAYRFRGQNPHLSQATRRVLILRSSPVPAEFYNILFVALHTNPIGGHFNTYYTLHCMLLWFYWLGMFKYIERMCCACPSCTLANPTHLKSAKLVYHFSIEAPMMVLHIDGYSARKQIGFEGSETYLIACCGMCTFAAMKPIINPSANTFASAIVKIIM